MVQKTYTPLGLDMGTWGLREMGFRGLLPQSFIKSHQLKFTMFLYVTYESEISLDSSEVSQLSCLLFSTVWIRRAQAIRFRRAQATRFRRAQATPRPVGLSPTLHQSSLPFTNKRLLPNFFQDLFHGSRDFSQPLFSLVALPQADQIDIRQ